MPEPNLDLDSSVPDWLVEHPGLLRLVEQLGIDYCCAGKSLRTAAQNAGLDPAEVLNQLRQAIASSSNSSSPNNR